MKQRRVLQVIGSFELGGSELQAINLSKRLSHDGTFKVFTACLEASGPLLQRIDWMSPKDVVSYPLNSFYDLNFIRRSRSFGRYIKEKEIDLVQTHDFYTNIFGMFSAAFCGLKARIASKRETLSKSPMQFFAERQAFRLAKKIVVNSEGVGIYLSDHGVSKNKIETIHNGIDLSRFDELGSLGHKDRLRSISLQTNAGARVITIVANMRSIVKDHRMFLRAAQKVREKIADTVFVLAGEGELREDLVNYAGQLGIGESCRFVGSEVDIPTLLSVSHVGVLSSRSEGFSNAIIEYMAAGLPVVATDVGGAKEAVRHSETGFLIASGDDEALATSLIELLENEQMAHDFGQRGKEIAYGNFSSEKQLEATLLLYESVLSRSRS